MYTVVQGVKVHRTFKHLSDAMGAALQVAIDFSHVRRWIWVMRGKEKVFRVKPGTSVLVVSTGGVKRTTVDGRRVV